jgi:sugar (pentulose or hexulose) kinase
MMPQPLIISYDIGSTSIKAAIFAMDGRILRAARIDFPRMSVPGYAEVDLHMLWEAFVQVTRVLQPEQVSEPAAIAISSQMAGLVLLDERFEPVRSGILGIDSRGEANTAVLEVTFRRHEIHQKTGCPLKGIYPAAKWLWLREHDPAHVRKTAYIGGIKEYLLYRLTGAWVTDPASASTTQWYDQEAQSWWREMCALLHIKEAMLPQVLQPDRSAGRLLPSAASDLRLPRGLPVIVGTGDGPAANLATGSVGTDMLCISLGTTTVTRYVRHDLRRLTDPDQYRQHFGAGIYYYGFRMDGGGTAVAKYLKQPSAVTAAADTDEHPLLFDPSARSDSEAFIVYKEGAVPNGSLDDRWKLEAVLEGILFTVYRKMIPVMEKRPFKQIRPIGGGTANAHWLQKMADLFQLPVVLTSGKDGTLGAAMIAAYHLGYWSSLDEAAAGMTRIERMLVPRTDAADALRERYKAHTSFMERRGMA